MSEQYKIVKSQLSIVGGVAGHNLIAVLDNASKYSMIFVLAHEVQHSSNYRESEDASNRFLIE